VRELIRRFWPFFFYAGLFSLAVNLLLLVPPLYMLQLFDRVISSRSEETLVMLSVGAGFALAVMALLDALRARLLTACGVALERKLGPRVLQALVAQTARLGGPEQMNGLRDLSTVRGFLVGSAILALFDAPWLPLFLLLIWVFHPLLGAIALAGALLMLVLAVLNERLTRRALERMQDEMRRTGQFVDASARNAELVSALGMLPALTRRWAALNDGVLRDQVDASRTGGSFASLTKLARQLIQMAMLAAGAWLVISQQATAGIMMAASIILGRALAPVEMLVAGWRSLIDVQGAWRRLDALLKASPPAEPGTELPRPAGEVTVERVIFGLPGSDRPILRGVSLRLAAGESLGIIGPSAAGKSTLARLIVGVWKPQSGTVRLDGADVATWQREQLGPHIGYVPQHTDLFSGTVAENIARLGEADAAAVIRAARRAHVHEILLRLPKGYDTPVGPSGQALSPGQRQCVALARALYGEPRLLVLDEPNSNMDSDGEQALISTLALLKQERVSVIIIAHRPALHAGMDKLLVLKQGAVEMFGPRVDILQRVTRAVAAVRGAA
jgi:ATP-binding cassette subfamily C exporter for protease/lipase/ATP-binding cassette subfamily C protein EexD